MSGLDGEEQEILSLALRQVPSLNTIRIQDLPKSPISRKRRYREEMSDESLEASKLELLDIKTRDISPATNLYLQRMIDFTEDLQRLSSKDPEYSRTKIALSQWEAALDSRLFKNEKYRTTLQEFRVMETNTILLRYGGYFAHHCNTLMTKSKEIAKANKTIDGLAGLKWEQVSKMLEKDTAAYNAWSPGSANGPPNTPMRDLVKSLADDCLIPSDDAFFSIHWYAKKCDVAHSGIEETGDLGEIANYIIRDREAIKNGVVVGEMANFSSELLSALKQYEKSFFKEIHTRKDDRDLVVQTWYEVSDEFVAREKKKEEAQLKAKLQSMTIHEVSSHVQRAKQMKTKDPETQSAINAVIEAEMERDAINKELKKLQKESGKAETKLCQYTSKFDKLCPEKK